MCVANTDQVFISQLGSCFIWQVIYNLVFYEFWFLLFLSILGVLLLACAVTNYYIIVKFNSCVTAVPPLLMVAGMRPGKDGVLLLAPLFVLSIFTNTRPFEVFGFVLFGQLSTPNGVFFILFLFFNSFKHYNYFSIFLHGDCIVLI